MKNIEISPVTRIEGHAKITVQVDDGGNVVDAHFHVMEIRGFEKFLEGAAVEEAPRITPESAVYAKPPTILHRPRLMTRYLVWSHRKLLKVKGTHATGTIHSLPFSSLLLFRRPGSGDGT